MNLKDIFNFMVLNSSLDFYWKDGELNLEKQRVAVEQDHIDELGLNVGQSQALPLGQQLLWILYSLTVYLTIYLLYFRYSSLTMLSSITIFIRTVILLISTLF
jgi:hypothetical protein